MKHRKKIILLMCLSLLTASISLTGCGANSTSAQTEISEAEMTDTSEEAEKMVGMVTSIDAENRQITIAVMNGEMTAPASFGESGGQPQKPDSESGATPEKPDGEAGAPPEMPDGEAGAPPEMPDGENGERPEMPGGDNGERPEMPMSGNSTTYNVTSETVITDKDGNTVQLTDIAERSFVEFTVDGDTLLTISASSENMPGGPGANGQPGGNGAAPTEYQAQNHYTENTSEASVTQESDGTDENIVWVSDGAVVSLSDINGSKNSDDSTGGDNSSFYGVGAAYLVTSGTLNITDGKITTDSAGGAGVFAYGDGVANVSDTTIITQQGTSGGIHVAGGGTLYAKNLMVETNGASSAAIRSDRGSGTMIVEGGTYISNGSGSPAVYSTADITVSDATLTATGSEAVCIEGKNSLKLTNCDVSSSMPDNEQNDCKWSVILYQSMSGDSEVGNSNFEMSGGSLSSTSGGLFYTTNTASTFTLSNVKITTTGTPDFFLKCTGNSNKRGWGSKGSNGADCSFTAVNQEMKGDVIWDSISTLKMLITEGSTFTGAILDDETNAGNGGDGSCTVTLDAASRWIVTGDSIVTTLNNQGTICDEDGNTVSVMGTDGTCFVKGNSSYTIITENYNA